MSVKRYSVIAITLCYILRYRIMLYHSIAKLSFLNVIALDTQEPSWRLNPNLDGYKKSEAGRLKVIYDLHIVQQQAGFLG